MGRPTTKTEEEAKGIYGNQFYGRSRADRMSSCHLLSVICGTFANDFLTSSIIRVRGVPVSESLILRG